MPHHHSPGVGMTIPLPTLAGLDPLVIPTPCTVPWGQLQGDDRSRFCGQCQRQVFDLSAMTTAETVELLSDPTNRPCVHLYRRSDGRVMTTDCPVGLRARVGRRLRRRAAWAGSLFAMLSLPSCRTAMQGSPGIGPGDYSRAIENGAFVPQGPIEVASPGDNSSRPVESLKQLPSDAGEVPPTKPITP